MLTDIATKWNSIPAPIRDFLESIITAGILGAGLALSGALNDPNLRASAAVAIVVKAFLDSAVAAARRGLAKPNP